ncbi:hypothetical protein ONA70_10930 [Micromonospora yasonensis]|uniref:hypothetical protein n=1 Tax=Micromonospora yasonensis TaxID=1128667 RepID=UPI00222E1B5C|nr:hypothetical protein [Micromonospora yasonensis]MCW3840611.1 hypothetical protein [Micromonospora yasonensis]
MGLTDVLGHAAVRHAHVLVAEVPGHWVTRAAVERHVLARGWRLARSPADADILAVCGPPGPHLTQPLAQLWEQLPGPRARIEIDSPQAVLPALDTARADLLDTARQRADSRNRSGDHAGAHDAHGDVGDRGPPRGSGEHAAGGGMERGDHAHAGHGDHGQGPSAGRAGHDGTEHAGHGGMGHGHGGMDMAPGGIPLAAGGEDRDDLEMDLLHLRLGPVLVYWPAGLVLRCTLQGDVIVDAQADLLVADDPYLTAAESPPAPDDPRQFAARRCDNALSLLGLAGWDDAVSRARRIRDALLFTEDLDGPAGELHRLRRRVDRSWSLRWSLRRIGPLEAHELARRGLPDTLAGDVYDRLLAMLDHAADSIAGQHPICRPPGTPVEAIPDLVRGWDLATARLIIASLDLDPPAADREVSRA